MMNKITAKIIADSSNEQGQRLTTFVLVFPRIILAEFNTHRMFSRNSASSRAIPFNKMVKMVEEDPFIPIAWQKDHKGMQGTEYFDKNSHEEVIAKATFKEAREWAIRTSSQLNRLGVTKQLCNRLLEPFMWHTCIVTATEWENFFELRCPKYQYGSFGARSIKDIQGMMHRAAEMDMRINSDGLSTQDIQDSSVVDKLLHNEGQGEIHIMALAEAMWDSMNKSVPKEIKAGEWHIPFGENIDIGIYSTMTLNNDPIKGGITGIDITKIKIATARCARVSYLNFEGKDDYESDIKLHDILLKSGHYSPFEHCAKAMTEQEHYSWRQGFLTNRSKELINKSAGWCDNFRGFIQYRKIIENEKI